MTKTYNTPKRTHIVKTRLDDEEHAEFLHRLKNYEMSQAKFIREAISGATIRPVIVASLVSDDLLAAIGKLTAEYGMIGSNLNQIARHLNEWHSPYPQLAADLRNAAGDLTSLKFEVLGKVGDLVGDIQIMNIGKAAPEQRPALVEQRRQPKPPKKPKPPKEKPTFNPKHYENPASKPKDPELVLIQKIADDMREPRSNGKPGTMIYEMTDAMESMIFRWNFCKSNYAAFLELEECWTEIRKLIRNGYDFLIQYDRGLPHSTDVREFTEVPPTALPHQGRRKVLPDWHLLTTAEIAYETPAAISKETPHDILYELDAALDSFTFRWSVCLSHNRDHFDTEENRTQIFQRAKNGIEYLNQILQGEIPLE